MMKIAVNARLLYHPSLRGWNRYTVNLLAELPRLGVELVLYADRPILDGHLSRLPAGSYQLRVSGPMRYLLWEQLWLPRQCARDKVDVLHCPFNFGLPWFSPCPRVLTLHDAIDQVYYHPRTSWRERARPTALLARGIIWSSRARADHVITDSAHAQTDLVHHLGLRRDKVTVIYDAADPRFLVPVSAARRQRVRQAYRLKKDYVFYVGGWEKRKNVPFLVEAFARANLSHVDLVLAGGTALERKQLAFLAGKHGIADRIHILGWIDDADLPALYAEALCFVYPSEYEGFGLQLCEAMATGCPTLAARAAALPEVLGNGGSTFSLNDPRSLADLLQRLAGDGAFRTELALRARTRAARFSWQQTARETLAVYQRVLKAA